MEQVDILTAAGELTGAVASRNDAHRKGLWHRTVHIWIRNYNGDLLLQRRSPKKDIHPGLWDISAAGHLAAGDTSGNAACREVLEELGVTLEISDLDYLFTVRQQHVVHDKLLMDNEINDVFLCSRPVCSDEITIDPVEVVEVAWYDTTTLKMNILEKNSRFVSHDEEYRKLFVELVDK